MSEEFRQEIESRPLWLAVPAALLLIAAGLIWYARTDAFAWDEGYHMVAAWMIAHGKQPYIDFLFPQTPLNAYWNAFLLRMFGESWRVPHTAAALLTTGAVAMAAGVVYRRLPVAQGWRAAAAVATAVAFGCNTAVVEFGTLQAYGMCLFMAVAAYLAATSAVDRPGVLPAALAGLFSGIAASSSLLTAPVAPVLLIWLWVVNRTGSRIRKSLAFIAGVVTAFAPLLRLLIRSPHPVIFGFLQYQLLYRKVEWDDAANHNLGEVLGWADSSQAVLLVLLAAAGILFVRKSGWDSRLKAEIYLCGWLVLAQTVHLLTARPTFSRYFLLTVPFLAIAAAVGLYEVTGRLTQPGSKPWQAVALFGVITCYGLAASLFEQRDDLVWSNMEETAKKVREVTPASATLLADEPVYFLLHRQPPSGMELEDSHKLTFSDSEAAALHVVPRPKLDRMIKSGRFDTIEMCDDDEIERLDLSSLYSQNATAGTCQVFWSRLPAQSP
jgi:hypothetical protein